MPERKYRLIYPPSLVNVPVIHQLIRKYDLTVNILQAQIDDEQGWLDLQLSGSGTTLEEALSWLQSLGIEIEEQNR